MSSKKANLGMAEQPCRKNQESIRRACPDQGCVWEGDGHSSLLTRFPISKKRQRFLNISHSGFMTLFIAIFQLQNWIALLVGSQLSSSVLNSS